MAAITLDIGGNTRRLDRDIQKTVNKVYSINLKTKGDQPLGRITGQVNEFNKSLDASNARVIAFGASAGIIFGVERAFGALVQATIEVQKSLQDINVILNVSAQNLQKFGAELFNIARNTGQSFQEVAKAATEFSRQGLGVEETLKRTNEALILSRLSGLDAAKSVEALTAAVNSYASQAVTATEVVNKFATVDAAFAVSSADLAEALSRVGSSAAQSGVSLNELIAIVTSAQQTTARGGAVIGNSFKTIFTRLQRQKVVDLLGSLGISGTDASGQVKSTIQLLTELGKVYDTLGSQQQAYIAEQVGGVFQINILKAALADLGKEYSIYSNALNVSAGATDQAIRRNEELNQTYAAQINALQENARQLAAAGGERLLGPSIDRLVGGTNTLLQGFTEADGQGVGAVLGKGILDGLGQFIAGPGLALIGGVLLKLFSDLAKFATGSIQQLLGLNTAATQQRDLQQSINSILAKNPQLLQLALKGEQGLNQAANSLLASLQKQTVELQKQAQVAQQISKAFVAQAGVRVAGGVPVVPTGRPGKAAGYIPNFAKDDFAREELLATALGAKNPTAQLSKGTIDGRKFIKNNREIEITNFGKNGDSAVIPTYAKGFIPNFAKTKLPENISLDDAIKRNIYSRSQLSQRFGATAVNEKLGSAKKAPKDNIFASRLIGARLPTILTPSGGGRVASKTQKGVGPNGENVVWNFPVRNANRGPLKESIENTFGSGNFIDQWINNNLIGISSQIATAMGVQPARPGKFSEVKNAKGFKGAISSTLGTIFDSAITTSLDIAAQKDGGDFDIRGGENVRKPIAKLFGENALSKGKSGQWLGDIKISSGPDAVDSMIAKTRKEWNNIFTGLSKKKLAYAGYIPNFAAIQDAVARERAAGIPSNQIYLAQEKALTKANPMGLGVFNKRDEPTAGKRRQQMRRKGFASGYVPNFAIEDPDQQAVDLGTSVAAVVTQLGFLAFSLQGSRQQYRQSLKELTDSNVRAAKNNLRAAREAGASEQVRRQLSQNVRTAQTGTAGQRFSAATGAGGFALSIGAPIIGETIKNIVGQETVGARRAGAAASAVGQIAGFTGAGAMFGPWGAAIGAATGALLTVPGLIDEMTSTAPEFAKAAKKASQDLTKFNDAGQRVLTSSSELSRLLREGGSQDLIQKAQQSYNKALLELSSADRRRLSSAAKVGKLEEEYAKILAEKIRRERTAQSETALAGVRDDIADFGSRLQQEDWFFAGSITGNAGSPLSLSSEDGRQRRAQIAESFTTELRGNKSPEEFLKSLRDIKIPNEVTNKSQFDSFINGLEDLPNGFKNILKDIAAEDPEAAFQLLRAQIIFLRKDTADFIKDSAALQDAENERQAVLEQERAALDATVSTIQKNIAVQNLLRSAYDNTKESIRSFIDDLQITQTLTQPREVLEGLVGADKTPTRQLAAQEGIARIEATTRAGLATASIDFKETLRGVFQEPFQENINKIVENLGGQGGALEGAPKDIITQSQQFQSEAKAEQQKLLQANEKMEISMTEFIKGQISTEQLLEQSRDELAAVGIDVSRGSKASDAIEKAVTDLKIKTIQEQVKATQQRAKLASETKQAILQSSVEQATKVFGGFERFMSGNAENNSIAKIADSLSAIESIRSSTAFRYTNIESQQVQESMRPELGRNFANLYTELINASGGAFREFIQKTINQSRQQTIARGGQFTTPSGLGGYDDIVAGIQASIENQLKEYEQTIQVTSDPVLKRDLQGFVDSIRGLGKDGTLDIARLQTLQGLGVARQSDFSAIYGRFENEALNRLKEISPELATSLSEAVSLSSDPLLSESQIQSNLQTEMIRYLDTIQKALLEARGQNTINASTQNNVPQNNINNVPMTNNGGLPNINENNVTQPVSVNLGGINLNINSTAQITAQDYEQLKPRIEQLLQTEVPNMLTDIQNVKQEVSILGRTKETVDNLLKNGNFTQYAPPPKTR